jgi:CBS domain-containing protein
MATRLHTLREDVPILDAVDFLLKHRVSGAPVVNADKELVGIISEKDCLKLVAEGVDSRPPKGLVREFMSRDVFTIPADMDIYYAAGLFLREPFRRFPVVEGGRLVGQVSRRDILTALKRLLPRA